MQISLCLGSRTVMSLRLCSRAPCTTSSSDAIRDDILSVERVFVHAVLTVPGTVKGPPDRSWVGWCGERARRALVAGAPAPARAEADLAGPGDDRDRHRRGSRALRH